MKHLIVLLAALFPMAALAGQPIWITIQNDDFHVYSSAGERDTRKALDQLERVRGFFVQALGEQEQPSVPVTVVLFGSEKEYQPYRLNEVATAYYASNSDRDLIVVSRLDQGASQIISHEYTHLAFRHGGYDLPPWLNEGVAELFSTLEPMGKDTAFGEVLPGRLQGLADDRWVPLDVILSVDQKSPWYNEKRKAGAFYNESWALVHMLATSEAWRAKFWPVVKAINAGMPSAKALESAYGMPVARIEEQLRAYLQRGNFYKLKVKLPLGDIDTLRSQPADSFDVREAEAEMLMGAEATQGEARARLQALAQESATRPEPWANLGYLAWRAGNDEEATADFARAYDLGSRNPKLLSGFANFARRSRPRDAEAALVILVGLEPKNLDTRLMLANLQASQGEFAQAVATVQGVRTARTNDERDRLLYLLAYASLRSGDATAAREYAEQLKRVSADADLKAFAEGILKSIGAR